MTPRLLALPQATLNIARKSRSNLLPWRGQFSPQLVEALLAAYAPKDALVADPFVGSGTVLCEAGRQGLRAFGGEINPAAAIMARTYRLINREPAERQEALRCVAAALDGVLPMDLPLFAAGGARGEPRRAADALLSLHSRLAPGDVRDLLEVLIVILNLRERDATSSRVFSVWGALREVVLGLPYSPAAVDIALSDARALPLGDECVGLVVTSPPYINVFNYHQNYRASAEAIGWDLLRVARSEIGANRKHRQNRFLTVVQYCLDMHQVLIEMKRVCRAHSQLIFIVGRESNVRGTAFFNGAIVEALATQCAGLTLALRQERVFKNKFGTPIYEDILHLVNTPDCSPVSLRSPRELAREVLAAARVRAPEDAISDLEAALEGADGVGPSPLFPAEAAAKFGTVQGRPHGAAHASP